MNGRTGWWGPLLAALVLATTGAWPGPGIPGGIPVPPAAPAPTDPASHTTLRAGGEPAWPATIRQGPLPLEFFSDGGGSRGPWPHSRAHGLVAAPFARDATLRAASRARAADLAYLDYALRLARARAGLPIQRSTAPPLGV